MDRFTAPADRDPLTLFEFSVRRVLSLDLMNENNTHQTWANRIFGYENNPNVRSELMSIVKREYSIYFSKELQYRFLEEKIEENFSYLFGIEEDLNLFDKILQALNSEYKEQKNPRNRTMYRVTSCIQISTKEELYVYRAQLVIEEGDDPHFIEGMPFDFINPNVSCEVVDFDYANATLFFSSNRKIESTYKSRVVLDATMNTLALIELLKGISNDTIDKLLPLHKFLNDTTDKLTSIEHSPHSSYIDELLKKDASQYAAFNAALDKDITFIWGPPGTGKSYTLSAIIMALHQMKDERTIVCCLSNVAVDQLVNKVVDIIEVYEPEMPRGVFYRAGRTQDEKLINTEFLYPDDNESRILRLRIKSYNNKITKFRNDGKQYSNEAIEIKARLKDARESLKKHTDYLVEQVRVVFSTIANFVINSRLKDAEFDNLIVDEASMLALPQLIAIARKVTKRIILVGDFQQLSPITVAGVPILKTNVFKLCGIDINHIEHPALHQLLNQRRSNPKLVDLINNSFYANRLVAKNNPNNPIIARAPYSGCVVGMYSINGGSVRFTKGGTRQNVANATAVMNLLDLYDNQEEETFSIGVITPYRGQVALLKAMFIEKSYSSDFRDRIKIGTVHTFQGSECDVIIFDMVDCFKFENGKDAYFGKIYAGEQGEQLINVAVSRARHKLIVVCDPNFLARCPGNVVSSKAMLIFNRLLKVRYSKI